MCFALHAEVCHTAPMELLFLDAAGESWVFHFISTIYSWSEGVALVQINVFFLIRKTVELPFLLVSLSLQMISDVFVVICSVLQHPCRPNLGVVPSNLLLQSTIC